MSSIVRLPAAATRRWDRKRRVLERGKRANPAIILEWLSFTSARSRATIGQPRTRDPGECKKLRVGAAGL